MLPVLFRLGPITLHTYGLLVAVGFLVGFHVARLNFERRGIQSIVLDRLALTLLLSGLLGARLLYVVFVEPRSVIDHPLSFFKIWEGGLVYFGGFLFGVVALAIFAHLRELSFFLLSDAFAAPLAVAHAIGRLGCFMAGCCYGRPTNSPLGVVFNNPDCLAPVGVRLHPTQLYEAAANAVLFAVLFTLDRKKSATADPSCGGSLRTGLLTALYCVGYGVIRFLNEFLRDDNRGPMEAHLSPSQWISLAAIVVGLGGWLYVRQTENR